MHRKKKKKKKKDSKKERKNEDIFFGTSCSPERAELWMSEKAEFVGHSKMFKKIVGLNPSRVHVGTAG